MTTDLDGIEQRLAKGIRPTKQEVEQLIALACSKVRLRTGSPKSVDEIEAEIRRRVNQILAAGGPSVGENSKCCGNCRYWARQSYGAPLGVCGLTKPFLGHVANDEGMGSNYRGYLTTDLQVCSAWHGHQLRKT